MNKLFCLFIYFVFIPQVHSQKIDWAKGIAGIGTSTPQHLDPGSSYCRSIAVDDDNNVYITGFCVDTVDFDPGPQQYFLYAGYYDAFIAKYNSAGEFLWAHVFYSDGNYPTCIKIDQSGNVLLTGSCGSDVDFDPGSGTAMVTLNPPAINYIYLAKFDKDGNFMWVKNMQSSMGVFSRKIDIDDNNNIFMVGDFYDSLDVDPGVDTAWVRSNQSGIFFSKFDSNGNLIWAKSLSDVSSFGESTDIQIGDNNDIFICGFFSNTVDFDPGPSVANITGVTTADRFFARYDENGNYTWAKSINTNNNGVLTFGRSIALTLDPAENVFITGDFSGLVDFDPGPGQSILNATNYSTYLCKYDQNGNLIWSKGLIGNYCNANNIEYDCNNHINLAGTFFHGDFDPGPGVQLLISTITAFMNFFAQYDSSGNYLWAYKIGNCGYGSGIIPPVFTIKNESQYVAGGFKQTGDFDPGPDSILLTMSGVGTNAFFAKYSSTKKLNIGNDTNICKGDTIMLDATTYNATYKWQDNSTTPDFMALNGGTFWVTISINSCTRSDTIILSEHNCDTSKIKMPNVFTPGNDQKNDVFKPMEAGNIRQYNLSVYNRWGKKLFESNDFHDGWDGKSNGAECSSGTYFYVVHCSFFDDADKDLHGAVTLIRND